MSLSTIVTISVGETRLEITLGSGSLGTKYVRDYRVLDEVQYTGIGARGVIRDLAQQIGGVQEAIIILLLNNHEASFDEEERVMFAVAYNAIFARVRVVD